MARSAIRGSSVPPRGLFRMSLRFSHRASRGPPSALRGAEDGGGASYRSVGTDCYLIIQASLPAAEVDVLTEARRLNDRIPAVRWWADVPQPKAFEHQLPVAGAAAHRTPDVVIVRRGVWFRLDHGIKRTAIRTIETRGGSSAIMDSLTQQATTVT